MWIPSREAGSNLNAMVVMEVIRTKHPFHPCLSRFSSKTPLSFSPTAWYIYHSFQRQTRACRLNLLSDRLARNAYSFPSPPKALLDSSSVSLWRPKLPPQNCELRRWGLDLYRFFFSCKGRPMAHWGYENSHLKLLCMDILLHLFQFDRKIFLFFLCFKFYGFVVTLSFPS